MSLIAIMARCTTIQFADCNKMKIPACLLIFKAFHGRNETRTAHRKPNLASLVTGLEGRPLERRLQGLHRLRPARATQYKQEAVEESGGERER